MVKKEIQIWGMHCASCALNIERKLGKLNGMKKANVNFATEKATVEYDENALNEEEITKLIESLDTSRSQVKTRTLQKALKKPLWT